MNNREAIINFTEMISTDKNFICNDNDLFIYKDTNYDVISFFRTIKQSKRIKVIISSIDNINLIGPLMNINYGIKTESDQDFEDIENVVENLKNQVNQKNIIFLSTLSIIKNDPFNTYININKVFQKSDFLNNYSTTSSGCGEQEFNGCNYSKKLIMSIIDDLDVKNYIETGTYRGLTTSFVSIKRPNLNIYTVESDYKTFEKTSEYLKDYTNIHMVYGNSIDFLKDLTVSLKDKDDVSLYYLDAHWDSSHPLRTELEIIRDASNGLEIIAIDDFRVPNRPSLYFDRTDTGIPYSIEWIADILPSKDWSYFYKDKQEHFANKATGQIYFYRNSLKEKMSKFIFYENGIGYSSL